MQRRSLVPALGSLSRIACVILLTQCSGGSHPSAFDTVPSDGGKTDGALHATANHPFNLPTPPNGLGTHGCTNLQCYQVACDNDGATTITGTVFDPKGDLPIYNARVYVPNAALPTIPDTREAHCDRCTDVPVPLVASALTDETGAFTLRHVPVNPPPESGAQLVVQVGQWRRVVPLPSVTACKATAVPPELTRLPRNSSEGHLPKMAVSTGDADPFECLLRKIGIDDSEFTTSTSSGTGRVHLYRGSGGVTLRGSPVPAKKTLLSSVSNLNQYDVVVLACEGDRNADDAKGATNFLDYLNGGGRAFNTHYNYTLINSSPDLYKYVTWNPSISSTTVAEENLDYSGGTLYADVAASDDGLTLSRWLGGPMVRALNSSGRLPLAQWRHDVIHVSSAWETWITADTSTARPQPTYNTSAGPSVQQFSFNTPLNAGIDDAGVTNACGKLVFTDFHVTTDARTKTPKGKAPSFPTACVANQPMTPQEKSLTFALFQLSTCVQNQGTSPLAPPTLPPPSR